MIRLCALFSGFLKLQEVNVFLNDAEEALQSSHFASKGRLIDLRLSFFYSVNRWHLATGTKFQTTEQLLIPPMLSRFQRFWPAMHPLHPISVPNSLQVNILANTLLQPSRNYQNSIYHQ